MAKNELILADLVDMDNPTTVFAEVKNILTKISRKFDFSRLDRIFSDTVSLYRGEYPGYRPCSTQYHDLRHTSDVLIALIRLIHGGHIAGIRFEDSAIELALSSALLHDSGYIQSVEDVSGTGAKYMVIHVDRSIGFMSRYFAEHGYQKAEYEICRDFIRCTSHADNISALHFPSKQHEILGKMTGTADLLGQFADRIYLEKLLFLYREFKEVNLLGYENEMELLRKTLGFYETARKRMANELGNMQRYMKHHFRLYWNINNDLYMSSIQNNLTYLEILIRDHQKDYRQKLKRSGVLQKLLRVEAVERLAMAERPWPPSLSP